VLKKLRGNRYKVPHMRKAILERLSALSVAIDCEASIVRNTIEFSARFLSSIM
jgi:hypothetical protein